MRKINFGSEAFSSACFLFYFYCLSSVHSLHLKATRQDPTNLPGILGGSQGEMMCSTLGTPSIIIANQIQV